jgi:L-alanine-DL-glutamate epimerase-like enolase superfamily enzyme
MKIEHVEVLNLRFAYPAGSGFRYAGGTVTARVTSLVRVHTDGPHIGLGAAYSHPDLVKLIVERHLAPHLVGRDPAEVEELWELMYGLTLWYGRASVRAGVRERPLLGRRPRRDRGRGGCPRSRRLPPREDAPGPLSLIRPGRS